MNSLKKTLTPGALMALPALALAAGAQGAGHGANSATGAAPAGHAMAAMHKDAHASMAGKGGNPAEVTRTIAIEMNDTMRFTPDKISVKAGETVHFFIVNKGEVPHEMVTGTGAEIDEHAEMMKKTPGMVHKEANQITLAPARRGGIVWQFAQAGTVSFACLVPGHREAGMVGTVVVN